jgi:hypothetical protein
LGEDIASITVMAFVGILVVIGFIIAVYIRRIEGKLERWMDIKFRRPDDDYSYEGMVLWLLPSILIAMVVLFYPFAIVRNNLPFYLGAMLGFLYPSLIMLFRLKIFSDASIKEDTDLGYHPGAYLAVSLGAGWFMTARGFSMLNFQNIPSELGYIVIALGLIAQTIPLFPDYLDKIVPFDLRSKAGLRFIGILAVFLFIITHIIWITVQSRFFGI